LYQILTAYCIFCIILLYKRPTRHVAVDIGYGSGVETVDELAKEIDCNGMDMFEERMMMIAR